MPPALLCPLGAQVSDQDSTRNIKVFCILTKTTNSRECTVGEQGKLKALKLTARLYQLREQGPGAPRAVPRTQAPSGSSESILGEGNAFLLMLFVTLYNFVSHLIK